MKKFEDSNINLLSIIEITVKFDQVLQEHVRRIQAREIPITILVIKYKMN